MRRLLATIIGICLAWAICPAQADAGFMAVSGDSQPVLHAPAPLSTTSTPAPSGSDWLLEHLLKKLGQAPADNGMQPPPSSSTTSLLVADIADREFQLPPPVAVDVPRSGSDRIPRHPELDGILRPPRSV